MIEYNRPSWQCEHCGRIFKRKCNAVQHEAVCRHNPDIEKLCYSCKHYDNNGWSTEKIEVWRGNDFEEREIQKNRCEALDLNLYNPFHMGEDLRIALEEESYMAMPTINEGCERYEQYEKH